MRPLDIIFEVTEAPERGYDARALGHSIFTQGEDWDDLKGMVRDAVLRHFDEDDAPRVIDCIPSKRKPSRYDFAARSLWQ